MNVFDFSTLGGLENRFGAEVFMGLLSKAKKVISKAGKTVKKGLGSLKPSFKKQKKKKDKKLESSPTLDDEDFEESHNLDDLYRRYREKEIEHESLSELYKNAQEDWWELNKEDNPKVVGADSIPHDSYKLRLGPQGYFKMNLNVVGISHGQEYFSQMDSKVKEFLRKEIENIAEENSVYLEDGFGSTVFDNYFEDHYNVEELDDRKLLGTDNETGVIGTYLQRHLLGPLTDIFYNLKRRKASEDGGRNLVMEASLEALEDPEKLPKLQKYVKAHTLPYRFRKDMNNRLKDSLVEKEKLLQKEITKREKYDPDGFKDLLKNRYELNVLRTGLKKIEAEKKYQEFDEMIGLERSKYMAHEAVRRSYEDREGEVWMFVGAAHQADIEQYLEDTGLNEIEMFATFQDFTGDYAATD